MSNEIKTQCSEKVCGEGQWGAFHPHQCRRYAVKDGVCTQHHPDYIEKRRVIEQERAMARFARTPLQRLRTKHNEALERIAELEAEIKEIKLIAAAQK